MGGNEALKLLKKCRFDLVITDVLMPDGGGVELIAQLKKVRSRVRILAISGGGPHVTSPTCLQLAQSVGAHALLLKPFRAEQLLGSIRQIMQVNHKHTVLHGSAAAISALQRDRPEHGRRSAAV
jgi:DNA-binding NtrC family response regulator